MQRTVLKVILTSFCLVVPISAPSMASAQELSKPAPDAKATMEAAAKGDAIAQFLLGRRYCLGVGVPQDYTEAARWFQRAAKQGNPDAQCELGYLLESGIGVQRSWSDARKWYELSGQQGHGVALYHLGWMLLEGRGGARDQWQGYTKFLLSQACGYWLAEYRAYDLEQSLSPEMTKAGRQAVAKAMKGMRSLELSLPSAGFPDFPRDGDAVEASHPGSLKSALAESQYRLARKHDEGDGLPRDKAKAIELYRLAAEQGHLKAEKELGDTYRWGRNKNLPECLKWYRKAAEQGDVDAQITLGVVLAENEEVLDLGEAKRWFDQAEAHGNVRDLSWLAHTYSNVMGDAKDFGAAARCLRKAADQGYPEAQRKLARAYEIGEGVEKDAAAAAKWYLKAAEAGDAEAQYNLAMMYSDGEGVEANPEEAKKWFHAAEIPRKKDQPRDRSIQEELAGRRERTAKTRIQAYAYFLIAQECRNPDAKACLESLEGIMSKNEIAESRLKADLVLNKLRVN